MKSRLDDLFEVVAITLIVLTLVFVRSHMTGGYTSAPNWNQQPVLIGDR